MQSFHIVSRALFIKTFALGTIFVSFHAHALAQADDPPERVGRIALLQGQVSYRPSAQDAWSEATVNMPMVAGTSIWTQPGSRAELQVGNARVRLDGSTEVDVLAVDYQNIQLSMPEGRVDIHLGGRRSDESYSIATPRATAGLITNGDYRAFAGDQDNPTRFATFIGEGQFALPSDTVNVDPGEEALASGDPPVIQTSAASKDDFDAWSDEREQRLAARIASRYVSPEVVGYEELDNYGQWRNVPDYGAVWIPTSVQAGWQPYRYGHWRWVDPWGWTWVDDAQWGFAPFHYGRWAHVGDYWGWVPGQAAERPVYAPALVAWVSDPGSLVVGAAIGAAVGWVTLGPGEAYRPWYHADDNYRRQVNAPYVNRTTINNINNVTVINNNTYINQHFTTVMPRQDFVSARSANTTALRVAPNAPVRIAATPQANLPAATQVARFGNGPHANAPKQATFATARAMQATRQPAVPVAGRFGGHALVRATPAAAANFRAPVPGAVPHAGAPAAAAGHPAALAVQSKPGLSSTAVVPQSTHEGARPNNPSPTVFRGGTARHDAAQHEVRPGLAPVSPHVVTPPPQVARPSVPHVETPHTATVPHTAAVHKPDAPRPVTAVHPVPASAPHPMAAQHPLPQAHPGPIPRPVATPRPNPIPHPAPAQPPHQPAPHPTAAPRPVAPPHPAPPHPAPQGPKKPEEKH